MLSINQWNEAERPREKLIAQGAEALTVAELLAIVIGSGGENEDAVALMKRVMSDCKGSLRRLGALSIEELCQYKGIGPAKAANIKAVCRLGSLREAEPEEQRPQFSCSAAICRHFRANMRDQNVEFFRMLTLDRHLRLLSDHVVSKGGQASTQVDPREMMRQALLRCASAIAICHNHPSGQCQPSQADDCLTERVAQCCRLLGIQLVDHIIIGGNTYYSYADEGRLPQAKD